MSYFVYMLLCERGKIYTGIAKDINKRFLTHTKGIGAKYTRANKPLKIIYRKEFETKSEALKEEYRIKQFSHDKKIKLAGMPLF